MVELLTVRVVLGPDLVGQAADAVPQFRALAVADHLRFHRASIPATGALPPGDIRRFPCQPLEWHDCLLGEPDVGISTGVTGVRRNADAGQILLAAAGLLAGLGVA